jgi:hypothetical protein
MIGMFREFDARLLNDEYRMMVSGMEDRWHAPPPGQRPFKITIAPLIRKP